jgi:hypothetical protein
MDAVLKLLPLVLLFALVVVKIRRGTSTRADSDRNRPDTGGGTGGSQSGD